MKSFYKALRRQDGFTLVELMVVVAIIGLLSAVAVPNFKKYQAKAKISEAKLQLSAIYTAQSAFFSDFNMYAGCLRYMGFDPEREITNRYYAVGFASGIGARNVNAHSSAVNSGMQEAAGTGCPSSTDAVAGTVLNNNGATYFIAGKGVGGQIALQATMLGNVAGTAGTCTLNPGLGLITTGNCVGTQADTSSMTFNAAAVGFISADNSTAATASGLTMDNNKVLRSQVNGY
jgi:type IV pilus assembly protein PilA